MLLRSITMREHKPLSNKLSLQTETLRVLTDDEIVLVVGGAYEPSYLSGCVSNGEHADCRSVMGHCPTLPPLTATRDTH